MQSQRQSSNITPMRDASLPREHVIEEQMRDLEVIMIAGIIIEPVYAPILFETVSDSDFYFYEHIVCGLRKLFNSGTFCDATARELYNDCFRSVEVGRTEYERLWRAWDSNRGFTRDIEHQCQILLENSVRRNAKKLIQRTLQSFDDPEGHTAHEIVEKLRIEADKLAANIGQEKKRVATFIELDAEIEAEISGQRFDFGWPWKVMQTSASMMPGSLITLCGGSGEGKSWFVFEMIWRPFFGGLLTSSMNLEKVSTFHSRRVLAQLSETSGMMNAKWCLDHPEQAREIKLAYADKMTQIEKARVFQTPADGEDATVEFLCTWMRKEMDRGVKILLLDPITNMRADGNRIADEERLVNVANKLVGKYQSVVIFSTHPKTVQNGIAMRPSRYNMRGSAAFHQFVDSVFWLAAHENREDLFDTGMGGSLKQEYNRTIFWLKTKLSGDGKSGKRVAFFFNHGKVCNYERGIIPEEDK